MCVYTFAASPMAGGDGAREGMRSRLPPWQGRIRTCLYVEALVALPFGEERTHVCMLSRLPPW